jgi:hypothetical protein
VLQRLTFACFPGEASRSAARLSSFILFSVRVRVAVRLHHPYPRRDRVAVRAEPGIPENRPYACGSARIRRPTGPSRAPSIRIDLTSFM